MSPETIAESLLMDAYHDVSAVVALDEEGRVLGVKLADTRFGGERLRTPPGAAEIWLLTNHACGFDGLYPEDDANVERVRRAAPRARLRVFITGEERCVEVEQARKLCYNGSVQIAMGR